MKEITESNRLIAEFMGYKYYPHPAIDAGWRKDNGHLKISGYYLCRKDKDLKYHSDWNWLIEVVEKIEALKDSHYIRFYVSIMSRICSIRSEKDSRNFSMLPLKAFDISNSGNSKISAVFVSVVYFIQWYNQQQTDK